VRSGAAPPPIFEELRLVAFPQVLGSGGRLFTELTESKVVRLTSVGTVGQGLARLTYELGPAARPSAGLDPVR
jgi:hypothetical protein